jgi:2-polyprenyl-3-methyl-5-hydroxy-6-metoxy-1,4-benzoquinol methylase
MMRFFDSFEFVLELSQIIGIDKTFDLILDTLYRNRRKLCSTDMLTLYGPEYGNRITSFETVEKVGPFHINYYNEFVFDHLREKNEKNLSILDIGCGSGELCLALAYLGYAVSGIDISESAIRKAIKRRDQYSFAKKPVFEVRDTSSIDGRYDYIILSDFIEHLSMHELNRLLSKCRVLLTENGSLLIHTPNGRLTRLCSEYRVLYLIGSFIRKIMRKQKRSLDDLKDAFFKQSHINVMGPKQLRNVLKKNRFRKCKITFRYSRKPRLIFRIGSFMSQDMGAVCR